MTDTNQEKPSIRASSLKNWETCERMAFARQYEKELREAEVIPAKKPRATNFATHIGSCVHELVGVPKMGRDDKIAKWLVDKEKECSKNDEVVEETSRVKSWDDAYAHITRSLENLDKFEPIKELQNPKRQDKILKEQFLSTEYKEVELTGHVDYFDMEHEHLVDIKCSGATTAPRHDSQLGAYADLLEEEKEVKVKNMHVFFVPIRTLKKPLEDIAEMRYSVDTVKEHARNMLNKAVSNINSVIPIKQIDLKSGRVVGRHLPASPGSMLCSAKYCPAHSTEFCPAYPPLEETNNE